MPARFQSAIDAAGVQAARIEGLWWLMFWVCAVVFVLVLAALGAAVWRGREQSAARPSERTLLVGVSVATGVTFVILIGLLYASATVGRAVATTPAGDAITIEVTGHQWWWDIEYVDPQPHLRATTPNELHIPIGRPVIVSLKSADVIHSFWIPNLHGKIDLVPGRENRLWLKADRPGRYRGQCAEYCGLQHAHMALTVVVEDEQAFARWLDAQRASASAPTTDHERQGQQLFESGPCALCHAVRGTNAGARLGPDLTHFASRATIAAGVVSNTREYLIAWLTDPQHVKPGVRMPASGLTSDELEAVASYLESLR